LFFLPNSKFVRRPRIFKIGSEWAIEFVLENRKTIWRTDKHEDALEFALNLWTLRARGLRRV